MLGDSSSVGPDGSSPEGIVKTEGVSPQSTLGGVPVTLVIHAGTELRAMGEMTVGAGKVQLLSPDLVLVSSLGLKFPAVSGHQVHLAALLDLSVTNQQSTRAQSKCPCDHGSRAW